MTLHKADSSRKGAATDRRKNACRAAVLFAIAVIVSVAAFVMTERPAADGNEHSIGAVGDTFTYTESGTALSYYVTSESPNEVRVNGYVTAAGDIEIPSIVTDTASVEYTVTSIGNSAFFSCSGLTSVIIPDSVAYIGDFAFYNCGGLTSVIIPNSVTSIGDNAFTSAGLTSVTIPDSVTSIGAEMFSRCFSLTSVTIPDSVVYIGITAFYSCFSLTSVTIPDSVAYIGSGAFQSCTGLTSVTIPDSVAYIDQYAFYGCSNMVSVTIPDSVVYMGTGVFSNCGKLGAVALPYSPMMLVYSFTPDFAPSATVIVYYEGVSSATAVMNGTDIEIAAEKDGAPITKMLIGTSLHGNDVAVITGPPWSFGAEAGKRYYATIAPVTVTVTSEEGGSFGYTMNDGVTWTPFIIDPLDSYEITDIPSGTHISIRAETDTGFIAVWEDTDGNITIGTVLSFTAVSDTEIAVTATPFTIGVPEPPDDPSGDTPGPPGVRISSDGSSVKLYLPFIILVIAILVLTEVLLHTRKRK